MRIWPFSRKSEPQPSGSEWAEVSVFKSGRLTEHYLFSAREATRGFVLYNAPNPSYYTLTPGAKLTVTYK